jgi:hypothetical protein
MYQLPAALSAMKLSAIRVIPIMAAVAIATLLPTAPVGAERIIGLDVDPTAADAAPAGVSRSVGTRTLGGGTLPTLSPAAGPAIPGLSDRVAPQAVLAENYPAALPDLKLSKVSIPIASDASGTFYAVTVTVHNAGRAASGWVELRFIYQGSTRTMGVKGMPAGGSVSLTQTVWNGAGENCALELRVDPHNFEVELIEDNNYLLTSACSTY